MSVFLALALALGLSAQVPPEELLKEAFPPSACPSADAAVLLDELTVDWSGSPSKVTLHRCIQIFSPEGARQYGHLSFPYNANFCEAHLDFARTITPEGHVLDVQTKDVIRRTPEDLEVYPDYADIKVLEVDLPAAESGAIVEWQVSLVYRPSSGEGGTPLPSFTCTYALADEIPIRKARVIFRVPEGTYIRWAVVNAELAPKIRSKEGVTEYTFQATDIPAVEREPSMPPLWAVSPLVVISGYRSWDDVARWLYGVSAGSYLPTPEIQVEAEELTGELDAPWEKVSAIFDFVVGEIELVPLQLGSLSGYRPRPAAEVLMSGYGDRKDKAALLTALLRAAGFEAYPVFISSELCTDVDFALPPTPRLFDHVIVAVRWQHGWLYLDPTVPFLPADCPPPYIIGKHGLLVLDSTAGVKGEVVETVFPSPDRAVLRAGLEASVSPDGKLVGSVHIVARGGADMAYRRLLRLFPGMPLSEILAEMISLQASSTEVRRVETSDPTDPHVPLTVELRFAMEGAGLRTGNVLFLPLPYPPGLLPSLMALSDTARLKHRKYPLVTSPLELEFEVELHLPEGVLVRLPEPADVENPVGEFHAHYQLSPDGKTVVGKRDLWIKRYCVRTEDYPLYRKLILSVIDDAQHNGLLFKPSGDD